MNKNCFVHIPKTAGTSLEYFFRKHYKKKYLYGGSMEDMSQKLAGRDVNRFCFFQAHAPLGFLENVSNRPDIGCYYYSMIRNPIRRVISLYNYMGSRPNHRNYNDIKKGKSLYEFLTNQDDTEFDNGQLRMLYGVEENKIGFGEIDVSFLEQVKINIQERFVFVGVQERFDESFYIFNKLLQITDDSKLYYVRRNISIRNSNVSDNITELIKSTHKYEFELYDFVDSLIDNKSKEYGVFEEPISLMKSGKFYEIRDKVIAKGYLQILKDMWLKINNI